MKPTPNMTLKVAIVRAGTTARAVAKRARLHETRLSAIANGRIVPNENEQRRIARALETTVDYLFGSEVPA
jgi:transcriptional regulator with XRE-family HTH domain